MTSITTADIDHALREMIQAEARPYMIGEDDDKKEAMNMSQQPFPCAACGGEMIHGPLMVEDDSRGGKRYVQYLMCARCGADTAGRQEYEDDNDAWPPCCDAEHGEG